MTTDPWRKDSPAVDAAKRALAMRKGKPTEDDAPPPEPLPGPKAKPLLGQLTLGGEGREHEAGHDA